ncbi:multidrug efflux SMR transporter [Candidatus Methylospira mobilis]|uniref:Guanidinium exporter n=1 Tax=Candidatus Methylospira mobilis TaxID=1808979 RepID=A0A5Q0BHS7_9GAMM|nr:multidrug efflux SMR transporter [Candidatus Methylospira mobilis]QFY43373.1 multidrug efflux SMR transporter [Candidatus Methylospira mobilis]WNV03408.1 multidrug efflux SMR transporter [Candidatus Methylospira mobilis]
MGWLYLTMAGVFEVCVTSMLKLSDGFTKFWPSVIFIVFSLLSLGFLNLAMKSIPLGTAYAVWTGIGAFGTVTVGILFFGDAVDASRLFFLITLIVSIIGLKFVSEAVA